MIKKLLQGMLVGVGAILPGVSGGMIAAAFNIYARLIEALNLVTKAPIKAVISIWEYLVGILLGVLIGFIIIAYVFYIVPIPATLLFIGLILGGMPEIYKLAQEPTRKYKPFITMFVTFVLMISLTVFTPTITQADTTSTNFMLWIVVGILLAVSLIVPGLSGTMLMLIIGFYGPLILLGKVLIEAVLTINIDLFMDNIFQLGFVGIGIVLTFLVLGKVFHIVLDKFPKVFYQIILGIIIASPINIIFSLNDDLLTHTNPVNIFDWSNQWYMWFIGVCLIPLGIYAARLFSKDEVHETKEN